MKYPYSVKVNGKWYAAGEEIPDQKGATAKDAVTEAAKVSETVENSVETVENAAEAEAKAPKKAKKDGGKE